MTPIEISSLEGFSIINNGEAMQRDITKVFCCDLLSVAMAKTPVGAAWITVMANVNTLAVASLTDATVVILAEGAALDEPSRNKAQVQGITVLATELPIFDAALMIHNRLIVSG